MAMVKSSWVGHGCTTMMYTIMVCPTYSYLNINERRSSYYPPILNPNPPRKIYCTQGPKESKKINLINAKDIQREVEKGAIILILATRKVPKDSSELIPSEIDPVIRNFSEVFPKDLPDKLLPMRDIQYAINLIRGESLPNLPCRHAELKRQVEELTRKSFVRKSMSPFTVSTLLTPKKDGT